MGKSARQAEGTITKSVEQGDWSSNGQCSHRVSTSVVDHWTTEMVRV
jgi:hypothetical protein